MSVEQIPVFLIHSEDQRMKPANMRISNTVCNEGDQVARCREYEVG